MMWQQLGAQTLELGWDFYGSVILFVVLVALAVPVWAAIGAATITMLVVSGALPLSLLGEKLFSGIDAFALTAVPLFILTGDVLVRTGLSRKFLDVAEALTCWAKGGFGSATVLVCGMFAAISGSDAAGAAAVGRMTIDRLVESGYPRPYACALVAAGACTGILIPPSIAYIIIGLVLGIAVSTLFLAAIIPGLLILVSILVTNIVMNRLNLWEGGGIMTAAEWRANLWRTVKSGWYAFLVPGIIFYGIFSGRLTPTEAGAVAVVVTMAIGFILGTLKFSDFPAMLVSSAKVNGVILPIIAFSIPLAEALAIIGVPQGFVGALTSMTSNEYMLIAIMVLILDGRGLRDGDDPQHRDPRADPLPAGAGDRDEPDPVLHHDDHRPGRRLHHAAAGPEPLRGVGDHRRVDPQDRLPRDPFVFFMLIVTLMIAYIPAFSTSLLPDVYR
jgi:C4-dicarboxylate transporter DctM subunit